jgi:hypothetical protein
MANEKKRDYDTDVDASTDAGAAGGSAGATQGVAGTVTGTSAGQSAGTTAGYSETSHKQATDVNVEETTAVLATLQAQDARMAGKFADERQGTQSKFSNERQGTHAKNLDNLAVQALQNAVETANMVSKQAVRHSDFAIDRQWNLNETDVSAAALLARLVERLNNPTPPQS